MSRCGVDSGRGRGAHAGDRSGQATPTPPRTAWGDPDLQGIWTSSTLTPLERPSELVGRETLTEEEAAASTARELERIDGDQRVGEGRGDRQSDTPDGRTDRRPRL